MRPAPKVAITGAGSGLGAAMAHCFAAAGFDVAVTDINPQRAEAVLLELMQAGFTSPNPAHRDLVQRWMDKSGVSADDVAGAVLQAMQQRRFLVLTHAPTRWAWWLKRWWPERYYRAVRRQASLTRRQAA